jgi:hypothetical protein
MSHHIAATRRTSAGQMQAVSMLQRAGSAHTTGAVARAPTAALAVALTPCDLHAGHRGDGGGLPVTPEVVTPTMDKLVKEGIELNRHCALRAQVSFAEPPPVNA